MCMKIFFSILLLQTVAFNTVQTEAFASELWQCKHSQSGRRYYTNRAVNSKDVRCKLVSKRFSYSKLPKGAFAGFKLPQDAFIGDDTLAPVQSSNIAAKRDRGRLVTEEVK